MEYVYSATGAWQHFHVIHNFPLRLCLGEFLASTLASHSLDRALIRLPPGYGVMHACDRRAARGCIKDTLV